MTGIYIVDNDAQFLQSIKLFFELADGYTVVGCGDGNRETLNDIIEKQPGVILMDYVMEDMNGLEMIQVLRASGISSIILVVTQHEESIYLEMSERAGANGLVSKKDFGLKILNEIESFLDAESQ